MRISPAHGRILRRAERPAGSLRAKRRSRMGGFANEDCGQNRRSPARSPHMGGFARRRRNAPPVENAPPRLGRLRRFLSCAGRSVLPRRRAWEGRGDAGQRGQYMAQRAAAPGEVAAIPLLCRPVGTTAPPRLGGSRGRGTARAIYSATRRRAWGGCGDSSPAPAGRYYRAAAPGRVAGTRDSAGNIWRNAPPRLGRLRRFLSCASRSVLPRRRAWEGRGDAGQRGQYMAQRAAAPGEIAPPEIGAPQPPSYCFYLTEQRFGGIIK